MVKMYVVGLPETAPVTPFRSVKLALMVAWTFCPEVPLYMQVRLNVASAPDPREPDNVRLLPPVQVGEAVPETASEPPSVTAEAPKLCIVTVYTTVPLPRVGSPLFGVLVKPNAVIFGMLETSRVSPVSPHGVETLLPLAGPAGLYFAIQK